MAVSPHHPPLGGCSPPPSWRLPGGARTTPLLEAARRRWLFLRTPPTVGAHTSALFMLHASCKRALACFSVHAPSPSWNGCYAVLFSCFILAGKEHLPLSLNTSLGGCLSQLPSSFRLLQAWLFLRTPCLSCCMLAAFEHPPLETATKVAVPPNHPPLERNPWWGRAPAAL